MSELHIAYDGAYRVYRTNTGIDRDYVGPSWPSPRSAAVYADTLAGRHRVSPLRAPGEESGPPLPDPSPGVLTDADPEPRPGK